MQACPEMGRKYWPIYRTLNQKMRGNMNSKRRLASSGNAIDGVVNEMSEGEEFTQVSFCELKFR